MSEENTTTRARRELERTNEDPDVIDWYCRTIDAYMSFGHSGGSMWATFPVFEALVHQKNLTPLTSDSAEWLDRSEISGTPIWQNDRNGEAFSSDGGKTYWMLNDSTESVKFMSGTPPYTSEVSPS